MLEKNIKKFLFISKKKGLAHFRLAFFVKTFQIVQKIQAKIIIKAHKFIKLFQSYKIINHHKNIKIAQIICL